MNAESIAAASRSRCGGAGAGSGSMRGSTPAFAGGALIGSLGGLIGLGGAEFRLPLLIGPFAFAALEAVIVNKAISLIVIASALPFRAGAVPFSTIVDHWAIVVDLLAGSLFGAWFGAGWATKLRSETLRRVIAVLLAGVAAALWFGHPTAEAGVVVVDAGRLAAGVVAGFGIGVFAALMGVAGGELLIPTLILLFGADAKLAGSLSLIVSLPTMIVGFARYGRLGAFATLARNRRFVAVMAIGSIVGSFVGARLLDVFPAAGLLPVLALILIVSAVKVWRHDGA